MVVSDAANYQIEERHAIAFVSAIIHKYLHINDNRFENPILR